MKTINVNIKILGGCLPQYQTLFASGLDLVAANEQDITMKPGTRVLIPTGLFLEIPPGFEAQVRPRSGLSVKYGITVLNTPGTIDSDYRGEVKVILINLGNDDFTVKKGERIAQLIFSPVVKAVFFEKDELEQTGRGASGFGSTGR